MVASQSRMDALAHNIANASTTAFKRQNTFVHSLERAGRQDSGSAGRHLATRVAVDFAQGELIRTGSPTHLALEGDGFFAVEGPEGEVYTRDGNFLVGQDGTLVTGHGFPVSWDRITGAIDPTGDRIVVEPSGQVVQEGREVGQLRVVDFVDHQELYNDSAGYWRAPLGLAETAHTASVRQGALEGSNVNALEEMVSMISVQRSFAGASNVLGLIGDTYRRLARL